MSHNALSFHIVQYHTIQHGIEQYWYTDLTTHDAISYHIRRYNLTAYKKYNIL